MFFIPRLVIRLVIFLAVLVGILVGINYGVQVLAQNAAASHIKSAVKAQKVTVHIGSFPLLYELAVENRVQTFDVVATGVPVGPLTLTSVSVNAQKISVDHHQLYSNQKVRITAIASARVTVELKLAGVAGVVATDLVHVSVGPSDQLVITLAGRQLYSVRLSQSPIVPDCPLVLSTISGGYSLTCEVAPVPPSLLAVLTDR